MNITLNSKTIAENYTPASPPPAGILADWLRQSGSKLSTKALRAALGTGQPVELVAGQVLEWQSVQQESP